MFCSLTNNDMLTFNVGSKFSKYCTIKRNLIPWGLYQCSISFSFLKKYATVGRSCPLFRINALPDVNALASILRINSRSNFDC